MPRNNSKDLENQENDEEREIGSAHRDLDEEQERTPQKSSVHKNEEERDEDSDEDTAEDIDLDDLQAMEGPDA
ncbi:MAG: hypothetical protein HOV81_15940 [Kofleriaceae bacterium]|nr:hypothetical protein [Kofleriaceae bacterium]